MSDVMCERRENVSIITFNRASKHNAFDDHFILALKDALVVAINDQNTRFILLKANGKHFCAGADLSWMERMASLSEAENIKDAMIFANLMYTLYKSPKPTIAMVQGFAIGGGAGIVAACDVAIASIKARFCFSEVKCGLIPAVVSPYVVKAIGARAAKQLFMSAQTFSAKKACQLQLIHHCVSDDNLETFTFNYLDQLGGVAPIAVANCKSLVMDVENVVIDEALLEKTAIMLAHARVSEEALQGLRAFLCKIKG